ncbi:MULTISPECIES: DMT family transporter [Alphaproteobacteria]|uniref:Membrane protein n=2 Tax=Alphaproteobacteria TaxID=28211 RepID=A0A512HD07_9HYPH|nr:MULTISPECIES: DMT family transporter [Alphaproteobacteria]GEO83325.1 membrane protein [Ciceribacter naphthalenivorans]GLR20281.1 membrane protein [Ciceribacter naphthalenivorans]GLT03137.1 membrane protein [Sphingomonas psychrolutea]
MSAETTDPSQAAPRPLDWLLYFLAPVFFSSNLIFGRGITGEIAPFTTAFLRWAGSAAIIFPFVYAERKACLAFVRSHTAIWLVLGILGMGICGGFVYWALTLTTASNATLIYTTSSLFIILLQWLFQGRKISAAELLGMIVAFAGVAVIVLKGDWTALLHLRFNIGDFGILAAAIAFALYSLLLRHPAVRAMPPMPLFGLLSLSGTLVLMPPALYEVLTGGLLPDTTSDWTKLLGIILFASLAAFYCFQHAVRVFGPAMAGVTLYLMPPISIVMAVVFLGERFQSYHAAGIVLVMGGLILATAPGRRVGKV